MKTIVVILLVLALFVITSCEKEPVSPEISFSVENYEGFWNNDIRSTTINIGVDQGLIAITIEGDVWTTHNPQITDYGISFTAKRTVIHNGESYHMQNDFEGVLTSLNTLDLSIVYAELRRPDGDDFFNYQPRQYGVFTR